MRRLVVALVVVLAGGRMRPAHASGFLLFEQSAEALSKGGAVTAATREPAAAWFNPAALAFMPAQGASLMAAAVYGQTRFAPADGTGSVESRPGLHVVPNLFGHVAVVDRVQVGLGLFAPFGLAVRWPDRWRGAEKSLSTTLRFLEANPSVAVRLHDKLAVAVGVAALRGDIALGLALPPSSGGRVDMSGGGWGWGANAALLYRPLPDRLHLAATFRTSVNVPLAGHADFSPEKPGLETVFIDQPVSSSLRLPAVATLGAMWRPRPRWEISLDANKVFWTAFDRLEIHFQEPSTADRTIERAGRNALTARLGGTWTSSVPGLVVRAGGFASQNASQSNRQVPAAPDGNRVGVGGGVGYQRGRATVDAGYLLLHLLSARSNDDPQGSYSSRIHALALTLTLH